MDSNECINTPGGYECRCKSGLQLINEKCEDIDECLTGKHGCDKNSLCVNTLQSYNCQCKEGFSDDGYSCKSLIQKNKLNNSCELDFYCINNSVCENTQFGPECKCKLFYYGDPNETCEFVSPTDIWVFEHIITLQYQLISSPETYQHIEENIKLLLDKLYIGRIPGFFKKNLQITNQLQ